MSSKDIIDFVRKNGKNVNVGVTPDNVFQFLANDVERAMGINVNMVPFQGGKPGVVALLGNQIDLTGCFIVEFSQYAEAGSLKAVAVAAEKRHPMFPDTPTFGELGVPVAGNLWGVWRFVSVPPSTPADRAAYLEAAFLEALNDPATKAAFEKLGDPVEPLNAAETLVRYKDASAGQAAFFKRIGKMK
jgi:tripartite-type tricarboxylate transporter receptor subunit TctC